MEGPDQLTGINGATYTYDSIGNMLSDGSWTYTWQHGKQLASMTKATETVTFEYNEDGLRTKKTSTSFGETVYTLHGKNVVHMTQGGHDLHFYYDAQGKPGIVLFDGTPYAYVYNLQGDVIALTDASGAIVCSYGYDSWGVPVARTGPMRIPGTVGFIQPFRYRGYVWDEETGLYYLRSRYYRPSWGRFVSADALILTNLYSYCNNDPVLMNDADGKEGLPFCVDEIIDLDEIDEQRKRRINENWDAVCAHSQQNRRRSNHVAVSRFMWRFGQFEKNKRNFRSDGDSGCAMCVRAGVLGRIGPHSSKVYCAGASSMFNNDMVISGDIEDVGGPDGLIVGMVVGTPMDGAFDDGLYHVEHVGVYAGYYDFGKGPVPAVYSFNTDTNRVNLRPFTDNSWKYYGWHESVVLDP